LTILIGIAFGVDSDNQKIGDVLVSTQVQPYEHVKIQSGQTIDRNQRFTPNRAIVNSFTNFIWASKEFRKVAGILLSGEKLIDDKEFRDNLLKMCKGENIVGGDMEAAGLASAAKRNGQDNWIVVKAICDFADGNKGISLKDQNQKIAARNSVDFCSQIMDTDILGNNLGIKRLRLLPNRENTIVNANNMFFYRQKSMLSMTALSTKADIDEELLRSIEGDNNDQFKKLSYDKAQKLRMALDGGDDLFCQNTSDCRKVFYKLHKGKHAFFPTNEVKAVIFDFDGTLTDNSSERTTWHRIWEALGYQIQDCDALHRKFSNNEITHKEWCIQTSEKFIDRHLTIETVKDVAKNIVLIPDTLEVLNILSTRGINLFICSGSIDTVIDTVFGDYKSIFRSISCNVFKFSDNGDFVSIKGTKFDFEGKAEFVKNMVEDLGIDNDECLYIGNSNNDEFVTSCGVHTLVVNPSKTNPYGRDIWTYHLGSISSMKEILPWVLPFD